MCWLLLLNSFVNCEISFFRCSLHRQFPWKLNPQQTFSFQGIDLATEQDWLGSTRSCWRVFLRLRCNAMTIRRTWWLGQRSGIRKYRPYVCRLSSNAKIFNKQDTDWIENFVGFSWFYFKALLKFIPNVVTVKIFVVSLWHIQWPPFLSYFHAF